MVTYVLSWLSFNRKHFPSQLQPMARVGYLQSTFIYLKDSSAERGRDTFCPLTHSQNSLSVRSAMVRSGNLGLSQRPVEWQNPKHWDLCCCFPKCISIYTLMEEQNLTLPPLIRCITVATPASVFLKLK